MRNFLLSFYPFTCYSLKYHQTVGHRCNYIFPAHDGIRYIFVEHKHKLLETKILEKLIIGI